MRPDAYDVRHGLDDSRAEIEEQRRQQLSAYIVEVDRRVEAEADLDRRVEITGPVDRKMIINAYNSGADSYMTDFEDSNSPNWFNQVQGQVNLKDAIRRTISLESGGKTYKLKFGHRGGNQPIMDLSTRKVEIAAENHGFAVDMESVKDQVVMTHKNLTLKPQLLAPVGSVRQKITDEPGKVIEYQPICFKTLSASYMFV